jgi:hypothetical protein
MMQAPIKPGKKWYVIGALLIALGIGGGVALGVVGFVSVTRTVDHFARFDVKGGGTVATLRMPQGGEYVVYYERRGNATLAASDIPQGLDVTMAGPDGRQVPFVLDRREFSFSVNERTGISVGRLTVPTAGSYKLTAKATGNETFTLAVGKGVGKRLVSYILGGLALAIAGFGAGLSTLIVTGVKRGRRKREAALGAAGGYAPIPSWSTTPMPPPPGAEPWTPTPEPWTPSPEGTAWAPAPPPPGSTDDTSLAGAPAPWGAPAGSEPGEPLPAPPWNPPIDPKR